MVNPGIEARSPEFLSSSLIRCFSPLSPVNTLNYKEIFTRCLEAETIYYSMVQSGSKVRHFLWKEVRPFR